MENTKEPKEMAAESYLLDTLTLFKRASRRHVWP